MDNNFMIFPGGMAQGRTEISARADGKFFESFGNQEILDASVDVAIIVEKSGRYLGIDLDLKGNVTVECDRCTYPLVLPVDVPVRLSVKFGRSEDGNEISAEGGREILWVGDSADGIDLSQIVYDFVCISLPMRRVHPDGQCDAETVKYLSQNLEESAAESPFAALKGLLEK